MTVRRGVIGVVLLAGLVAGCAGPAGDPVAALPAAVGSQRLTYEVQRGTAAHDWAIAVAREMGLSEETLTSATGFTAPGPLEFQSYVLRAPGTSGASLVDAFVHSFGFKVERTWNETVVGRDVLRVLPLGFDPAEAFYVHAADDMVFLLAARRAEDAAAFLANVSNE